ncbi:MAG TPA: hypothetical protein PLO23_05940 [Alphaproteobacteria bacterium]|nr:hypothetical protein [Alphaproteobacteria bacterium]
MLGGLDNEVLGGIAKAGALVVLTAAAKYQLDKIAVHYGITLDPNIKDIVEPTAWPTGVINPETGNEFKEFRAAKSRISSWKTFWATTASSKNTSKALLNTPRNCLMKASWPFSGAAPAR